MIQITDLKFRYPHSTFRLNVPRMIVGPGETVAVVGPSGSGKTTLLNLVAGILVPSSGKVITNKVDLAALNDSRRRAFRAQQIGMVFQEFELLEHLNVMDNILLPCRLTTGMKLSQTHRTRAEDLATELGLADKLPRYVRKLSQGERQRVALCRALLLNPPLLLCDEPTGNLDTVNKQHVLELFFRQVQRNKTTLLAVTHDQQILPRFDQTIDFSRLHGHEVR